MICTKGFGNEIGNDDKWYLKNQMSIWAELFSVFKWAYFAFFIFGPYMGNPKLVHIPVYLLEKHNLDVSNLFCLTRTIIFNNNEIAIIKDNNNG